MLRSILGPRMEAKTGPILEYAQGPMKSISFRPTSGPFRPLTNLAVHRPKGSPSWGWAEIEPILGYASKWQPSWSLLAQHRTHLSAKFKTCAKTQYFSAKNTPPRAYLKHMLVDWKLVLLLAETIKSISTQVLFQISTSGPFKAPYKPILGYAWPK